MELGVFSFGGGGGSRFQRNREGIPRKQKPRGRLKNNGAMERGLSQTRKVQIHADYKEVRRDKKTYGTVGNSRLRGRIQRKEKISKDKPEERSRVG